MKVINSKKAVMIGCGFVGSASVFALMQSGLFTEIVLIDADKNKAEGEAMDISHGIPFASPMKIYAGDYDDVADAAIVVISAGAGQKPGETRLDLVNKNVAIFKSIIPEIAKRNFAGIMLVVANPVSAMISQRSRSWILLIRYPCPAIIIKPVAFLTILMKICSVWSHRSHPTTSRKATLQSIMKRTNWKRRKIPFSTVPTSHWL